MNTSVAGFDKGTSSAQKGTSEQKGQAALHISTDKFLAFIGKVTGANVGREDDEHPLPSGPWDPVIRAALERTYIFGLGSVPWGILGPSPDPWKVFLGSILQKHPEIYDAIGGGHNPGGKVALNPQPLPPRVHFMVLVAQIVIARDELLSELASATLAPGERQGIIIVGGYVNRFCEDWCGSEFRVRWPFPGPPPRWFTEELNGLDLVVLAAEFQQGSREASNSDLRQSLADASAKLVEAGISRME